MGSICSKKKKQVRIHELAFMGACTEGAYNNPGLLDKIYAAAEQDGATDQIFEAKDDDGNHPLHKAAMYGNPTCVKWIVEKWAQE